MYRNLGFFAFSFALVNRSFAIFWMADLLAWAESALAGGLFDRRFGDGEVLTAAGEELRDVFDGVVGTAALGRPPSVARLLLDYRFACPRANFLTLGFFDPRG